MNVRHMAGLALWLLACGAPPVPRYAVADRGADRDGDGAADIDDACPTDPEDGLPPRANDGCPADDPDQDGIARADDQCPAGKEDGLGPAPADGCPTTEGGDADGDGVADARDACPNQAEDNLNPNPGDGCPASDTDGDGVADADDRCPDQPETINAYRDDDGCPDQAGVAVTYDEESHRIYVPDARKIEFEPDSAELTPTAQQTLDEVAVILKERPQVERLEIEGHASTQGHAAYNVGLTEQRASAVARGLVARGVAAKRLVIVGYGEFCPRVKTEDEVDEPRNRRVELKVVVVNGVWQDVTRGCWPATAHGIDATQRRPGDLNPRRYGGPPVQTVGGA